MLTRILLSFVLLLWLHTLSAQVPEQFNPSADATTTYIQYTLPLTSGPATIPIQKIDGHAIYEGDIVLYELGSIEDPQSGIMEDAAVPFSKKGQHDYRWPKGEIPYIIETNHPRKTDIENAINIINEKTVLNLRLKTDQDEDYVEFRYLADRCSSNVGRTGNGRQFISIGTSSRCANGSILHEILHCAGMYHEQSRADRDQYVKINFENIEEGREGNFNKQSATMSICEYDYGSIMHYWDRGFGIKDAAGVRQKTIVPHKELPEDVVMGQRVALSDCDIDGILNIYKNISPKAKKYEPYWFGDIFTLESNRVQGAIYRTGGVDWDFKAADKPVDASMPAWKKELFESNMAALKDLQVKEFTFDQCNITIKTESSKSYTFDIRFGRADLYTQWYEGQYSGSTSQKGSKMVFDFNTKLNNCEEDSGHTYFVVLVARILGENGAYSFAPVAIRYFQP